MSRTEELNQYREITGEQAMMQKLFVKGHLLIGADLTAPHINNFLMGLGEVCGMNIFSGSYVKTPDHYDLDTYQRLGGRPPEDVNGSVMWDDSGAQMYVFPRRKNWFTLDVYTCKEFDPERALAYTYEQLAPREDMMFSTSTTETNSPWRPFILPDGQPLNPEIEVVSRIDQLFDSDLSDSKQAIRTGTLLREAVNQAVREGFGSRVAQSYTHEQLADLRELHGRFEIKTDYQFMDDISTDRVKSPDQYPLQSTYDRLSKMEANAANLRREKPVVHIGTGWPGTAIGLYRQFGIPVTCVEKDPDFAQRSKEGLARLGLLGEDKLQVISADGTQLNPRKYQAVIVSAMVPSSDKEEIIRNMRALTLGRDTDPLLILRTSADQARSLFYQPLPQGIWDNSGIIRIADTAPYLTVEDPIRSTIFRVNELTETRRGFDKIIIDTETRLQLV